MKKKQVMLLLIILYVFLSLGLKAVFFEPSIDELIISTSAIKINCNASNADKFLPEEPHLIPLLYGLPLQSTNCNGLKEIIKVKSGENEKLHKIKDVIFPLIVVFRFQNLLSFLLFLIVFGFLSRKFFGSEVALFSVTIFSILPAVLDFGFRVYYEFWFLFFFFLTAGYYVLNSNKKRNLLFYFVLFVLFVFLLSTRSIFPLIFFPVFVFFERKKGFLVQSIILLFLVFVFFLTFVWRLDIVLFALTHGYRGEAITLIRHSFIEFIEKLFFQLYFFVPGIIIFRKKLIDFNLVFFYWLLLIYFVFFSFTRGGTEERYILVFLALSVFLFSKHLLNFLKLIWSWMKKNEFPRFNQAWKEGEEKN